MELSFKSYNVLFKKKKKRRLENFVFTKTFLRLIKTITNLPIKVCNFHYETRFSHRHSEEKKSPNVVQLLETKAIFAKPKNISMFNADISLTIKSKILL